MYSGDLRDLGIITGALRGVRGPCVFGEDNLTLTHGIRLSAAPCSVMNNSDTCLNPANLPWKHTHTHNRLFVKALVFPTCTFRSLHLKRRRALWLRRRRRRSFHQTIFKLQASNISVVNECSASCRSFILLPPGSVGGGVGRRATPAGSSPSNVWRHALLQNFILRRRRRTVGWLTVELKVALQVKAASGCVFIGRFELQNSWRTTLLRGNMA